MWRPSHRITNGEAAVYKRLRKQLALLRIMNLLLRPPHDDAKSMLQRIDAFTSHEYDKVAEAFASLTVSVPIDMKEYDRLQQNRKAALFHSKFRLYLYDDADDHAKIVKIAKIAMFVDCDAIYFEEMNNLVVRIAAFARFLMDAAEFASHDNRNGNRLLLVLKHLRLHHAWQTKIWGGLSRTWQEYHQKMANVSSASGAEAEHSGHSNYAQQQRMAKVAVVMNCQLFRFWEAMFKSALMGKHPTVRLLSYLVDFGEIIFEDYKLRIQKLARLMADEQPRKVLESWRRHI